MNTRFARVEKANQMYMYLLILSSYLLPNLVKYRIMVINQKWVLKSKDISGSYILPSKFSKLSYHNIIKMKCITIITKI